MPLIPDGKGGQKPIVFKSGQPCQVRNDDPDCPIPRETYNLIIGENNQLTATTLMLNVESVGA